MLDEKARRVRLGDAQMNAVDRVMRAYLHKHRLTGQQTSRVRAKLSAFVKDLMLSKIGTPEPPARLSKLGRK
jgi:hypothetical protein